MSKDSDSARDRGDQIHGHPCDGRAFIHRVTDVAVDSRERYWHLSRDDQFIEARTIDAMDRDLLFL